MAIRTWANSAPGSIGEDFDWQPSVLDKDLTTPPVLPNPGDRYIIASPAVGDWATYEEYITEWTGTFWDMTQPNKFMAAPVEDEGLYYYYDADYPAGTWAPSGAAISHSDLLDLDADDHLQYVRTDGTRILTGDWDIGDGRKIIADAIWARDAAGLTLGDDSGTGITIADGGKTTVSNADVTPFTVARTGAVSGTLQFSVDSGPYVGAPGRSNVLQATEHVVFRTAAAKAFAFVQNVTELARFATTGNLGIAESAPGSKVGIKGNLSVGATYAALAAPANGAIIEGSLGVGVSALLAPIHLRATPVATYGTLAIQGDAAGSANVAYISFVDSAGARTGYIGDYLNGSTAINFFSDGGNLQFGTGGTVHLLVHNSGKVAIGNGAGTPDERFHVVTSAQADQHMKLSYGANGVTLRAGYGYLDVVPTSPTLGIIVRAPGGGQWLVMSKVANYGLVGGSTAQGLQLIVNNDYVTPALQIESDRTFLFNATGRVTGSLGVGIAPTVKVQIETAAQADQHAILSYGVNNVSIRGGYGYFDIKPTNGAYGIAIRESGVGSTALELAKLTGYGVISTAVANGQKICVNNDRATPALQIESDRSFTFNGSGSVTGELGVQVISAAVQPTLVTNNRFAFWWDTSTSKLFLIFRVGAADHRLVELG